MSVHFLDRSHTIQTKRRKISPMFARPPQVDQNTTQISLGMLENQNPQIQTQNIQNIQNAQTIHNIQNIQTPFNMAPNFTSTNGSKPQQNQVPDTEMADVQTECPCGHLHGPGQGHHDDVHAFGLSNVPLLRGPD